MANYTLRELEADGLAPTMELLIAAAKTGDVVTYGKVAARLEAKLKKSSMNPRQMGWVVGALMDHLLSVDPNTPLINTLVVRGDSDQPGVGADSYLRHRFKIRGRISPTRRKELVQAALNEVRIFKKWDQLFEASFSRKPERVEATADSLEEDGQGDNPRYGGLPESEEHKLLKEYVLEHPNCLRLKMGAPTGTIERRLLSGDEMDVEFVEGARRIGVEVKSIRSGNADLLRGIYQCVKYRAVMIAQSGFEAGVAECEVVLVSEVALPSELRALAKRLDVPLRVVPVNRVS